MYVDFFLNTRDGMVRCSNHDIYYIESFGKHSKVVTSHGEFFVTFSINKLETDCLPAEYFCRVDRSFIVSLENLRYFSLDKIVMNGTEIPVSKAYRVKFLNSLRVIW
jgi:DNA-binding LytR/AlgR family response regulator